MVEFLIMITLGILLLIMGLLVWKKEKIKLIHSYHYKKVAKKDTKNYIQEMGKSLILISIGLLLTGITVFITSSSYGWIFFIMLTLSAFKKMSNAQKKYNNGWF